MKKELIDIVKNGMDANVRNNNNIKIGVSGIKASREYAISKLLSFRIGNGDRFNYSVVIANKDGNKQLYISDSLLEEDALLVLLLYCKLNREVVEEVDQLCIDKDDTTGIYIKTNSSNKSELFFWAEDIYREYMGYILSEINNGDKYYKLAVCDISYSGENIEQYIGAIIARLTIEYELQRISRVDRATKDDAIVLWCKDNAYMICDNKLIATVGKGKSRQKELYDDINRRFRADKLVCSLENYEEYTMI